MPPRVEEGIEAMKGCRPLTVEEIDAALGTFQGRFALRNRALFMLGIKSGFRIRELCSLRVRDVIQRGHIKDDVTVARRNMKRKQEGRTVFLNDKARAALVAWLPELYRRGYASPESFVFQSQKGFNRPISIVQGYRVLQQVFDALGMTGNLGTHSMRKSFANAVYAAFLARGQSDPLRMTAKAMGHKSIDSTDRYLSFRREEVNDVIRGL
ncbi:MAG: tyrosine-type recombinase/integrase [Desulfovibrionaceae bacterium]